MIVLDSGALFAALVPDQAEHDAARRVLAVEPPPRLLSPFALAELAYLIAKRGSIDRKIELLEEVGGGAYDLVPIAADDVSRASVILKHYRDLGIGLTDASLVALAHRYGTNRIFTLDHRHFRALKPLGGGAFELLPAEA